MPWVRSALVCAMSLCRAGAFFNAVSSWMTAWNVLPSTALSSASRSMTSTTIGDPPSCAIRLAPWLERVMPDT